MRLKRDNHSPRIDQRHRHKQKQKQRQNLESQLRSGWVMLLSILVIGLVGCGSPAQSADEVAEIFFQALIDRDFLKAADVAEPHTSAFLRLAHAMAEAQRETGELLDLPQGGAIVSSAQIVNENQAVIQVERNHRIDQINLVKIEGHWRVRLPESIF